MAAYKVVGILTSLIGLFTSSAFGATMVPASTDSGRVGQTLESNHSSEDVDIPDAKDDALVVDKNVLPQGTMAAQLEQIKFKLEHITLTDSKTDIDGYWMLLKRLSEPYINKVVSLADIHRIANQMEYHYRQDGYMLVQVIIPPQKISKDHARIKLTVLESQIDEVNLRGGRRMPDKQLKAYGKVVERSDPLEKTVLERNILLANDIPGAQVKALLLPSRYRSQAADLDLEVKQRIWDWYVNYNNRGTHYVGPQQIQLGASVYSLWGADKGSISYARSLPRMMPLIFYTAQYDNVFGEHGTSAHVEATHTRTKPEDLLKPLGLDGETIRFEGNVTHPWIRSREVNLYTTGGFYWVNSKNTMGSLNAVLYNDRIRAFFAEVSANLLDDFKGLNSANASATFGIEGFNSSIKNSPELSRPKGNPHFTKLNGGIARTQYFCNDYSLLMALDWQTSYAALLASEQFGYGGAEFGRGYDSSEITGDKGAKFKVEARYDLYDQFAFLKWLQPNVFYDFGKVWNLDKVNQKARQSASSAGLGFRFSLYKWVDGNFELAKPLTKNVSSRRSRGTHFYFSLTARPLGQ